MPEWLYEAGIGECRAALVEDGRLIEMAIERDDDPPRAGTVLPARLSARADGSGRGQAVLEDGTLAQFTPVPAGLTEGARLLVEIIRETLPEGGTTKPMRVRAAAPDQGVTQGPDLLARIAASGIAVHRPGPGADLLEAHGWSEALEEAAGGVVARRDVMLRIALTPAMTLIDVDGNGPARDLAIAGAREAGEAIRRFGIAGSIGIDLPTLTGKADRLAAAAALDAALPQPFERTAVNGFGFLQIVRRRVRPSLMERLAADPVAAAALALLRRGERAAGHGALTLSAAPPVIARLAARPDWIDALAARAGASVTLRDMPRLAISAGDASRAFP